MRRRKPERVKLLSGSNVFGGLSTRSTAAAVESSSVRRFSSIPWVLGYLHPSRDLENIGFALSDARSTWLMMSLKNGLKILRNLVCMSTALRFVEWKITLIHCWEGELKGLIPSLDYNPGWLRK